MTGAMTVIKARVAELETVGVWIAERNAASDDCESCGHSWGDHLLCATSRPPTAGWIECPVEGCQCHSTWRVPADTAEQLRQHHKNRPSDF
jgi:hypothetical protein